MDQASVIYRSPYPMPAVPTNQSISQFLLQSDPDDTHPDTVIIANFDNPDQNVTYGGLRHNAARHAAALRSQFGLREGDSVCIYGFNSVSWASLAHAVLWAGGFFCGINPLSTSYELQHYFRIAQPTIIAADSELLPNVRGATGALGIAAAIISIDGATGDNAHAVYPRGFVGIDRLPPFDLTGSDSRLQPAAMCFSSGTSGSPKAVVMTHYNLIAQLLGLRSTNPFLHSSHLREVFFPTFAHVYGLVSGILVPAWVGSYLQAMKRFEYRQYLQRCSEIHASILRLVPSAAIRILKDSTVRQLDLKSVRAVMCSGASLSGKTSIGLKDFLGLESGVLNGYGMTEATVTLLRETRRDKSASVGRPAAGISIRVVDDQLNDVAQGVDGECLVRGPTVFLEYKSDPKATSDAKTKDGWLRTGDVVRVDTDGFFYLTGRKKELIKFRGNQVAPAELEAILLQDARVADAGVCGVYDKALDTEIPFGFVTLVPNTVGTLEQQAVVLDELREYVNRRVAPYKRFRTALVPIEALPKNASGKLLRRHLAAKATDLRTPRAKI